MYTEIDRKLTFTTIGDYMYYIDQNFRGIESTTLLEFLEDHVTLGREEGKLECIVEFDKKTHIRNENDYQYTVVSETVEELRYLNFRDFNKELAHSVFKENLKINQTLKSFLLKDYGIAMGKEDLSKDFQIASLLASMVVQVKVGELLTRLTEDYGIENYQPEVSLSYLWGLIDDLYQSKATVDEETYPHLIKLTNEELERVYGVLSNTTVLNLAMDLESLIEHSGLLSENATLVEYVYTRYAVEKGAFE